MKKRYNHPIIGIVIIAVFVLLVVTLHNGEENELPTYDVASDTAIISKDGRSIEIHVDNPNITKEQCKAMIKKFEDQAGPQGQVSVRKPSQVFDGDMMPWCARNMEEEFIHFYDYNFDKTPK